MVEILRPRGMTASWHPFHRLGAARGDPGSPRPRRHLSETIGPMSEESNAAPIKMVPPSEWRVKSRPGFDYWSATTRTSSWQPWPWQLDEGPV
jgi:hypothetical protein